MISDIHNPSNAPIKVAIVDDHPMLIRGLESMLSCAKSIKITGTYLSGASLLNALPQTHPDVLLMDIQMPEQDGEELARILHKQYPELAILAFTNLEHRYYIKSMIQYGVLGYVLKSSGETVLLQAIQAVHKGERYFDTQINQQALKVLKSAPFNSNKNPLLTEREREILQLIADDLSSREIAKQLYITKRTVDFHRQNLLLKMDVKNAASLVKKAIDMGFIK